MTENCQLIGYHCGTKRLSPGPGVSFAHKKMLLSRAGYIREKVSGGDLKKVELEGFTFGDLFRLTDDSMKPTFEKGDHLVCLKVQSLRGVPSGSIIMIRTGGRVILKRVHLVDGALLFSCDGKTFPVCRVEEKEITGVWKVKAKLTFGMLQKHSEKKNKIPGRL